MENTAIRLENVEKSYTPSKFPIQNKTSVIITHDSKIERRKKATKIQDGRIEK